MSEPLKLNYKELIQEKLAYIPSDYLAYLYQVVSLMAQNFEPARVSPSELENYVQTFKTTFGRIMKKERHFRVAYQLEHDCVWLQWTTLDKQPTQDAIGKSQVEITRLAAENETDVSTLIAQAQQETQILFTQDDIVFCKSALPIYWTTEKAQADARQLFGVFMQYLPTYRADEETFGAED
jgi:hypothetical protein